MIAGNLGRGFCPPYAVLRALSVALFLAVSVLGFAPPLLADCGDSLGGERVPCRCGDIVVTDTRLQPDDPIVVELCPADGLAVWAPLGSRRIVLDLNGQEIRGTGAGTGIHVIRGGAEGAEIVGGVGGMAGAVTGFGEGVRASRPDDLRLLANVVVRKSTAAGVNVRGNRASLESVRVEDNGGDGLRASGRSVDVTGLEAEDNGGRGIRDHARSGERDVTSHGNHRVRPARGRGLQ